jgi:hypothetical protein
MVQLLRKRKSGRFLNGLASITFAAISVVFGLVFLALAAGTALLGAVTAGVFMVGYVAIKWANYFTEV